MSKLSNLGTRLNERAVGRLQATAATSSTNVPVVAEPGPNADPAGGMACIKDSEHQKMADKVYESFISVDNFTFYPQFLQELDSLIEKFRMMLGTTGPETEQDTSEETEDDAGHEHMNDSSDDFAGGDGQAEEAPEAPPPEIQEEEEPAGAVATVVVSGAHRPRSEKAKEAIESLATKVTARLQGDEVVAALKVTLVEARSMRGDNYTWHSYGGKRSKRFTYSKREYKLNPHDAFGIGKRAQNGAVPLVFSSNTRTHIWIPERIAKKLQARSTDYLDDIQKFFKQ